MALKYPCLIVDHDDTVVNSTATVHFPCFETYVAQYRPGYRCTLEHYFLRNFDPGVVPFFRDEVGLSEAEMVHEQAYWNAYVQHHVPEVYPRMAEILWRQKREGGLLCVISHSYRDNILRDYRENGLPEPDAVYGWELPSHLRKPSPWAVGQVMEKYRLTPGQVLVLDDLKPGLDMARSGGVDFAAAGWANDIPEIEGFMRENCDHYFKTVEAFGNWLFDGECSGRS
jgi:phosphoglycolate phosphatase/pyrophosphatase PpaX